MKKNVLIIGSSSDIAKSLTFSAQFNYIKLSSKTSDFNILDPTTFPEIQELDGLVYFPGSINLRPFNSIKKLGIRIIRRKNFYEVFLSLLKCHH